MLHHCANISIFIFIYIEDANISVDCIGKEEMSFILHCINIQFKLKIFFAFVSELHYQCTKAQRRSYVRIKEIIVLMDNYEDNFSCFPVFSNIKKKWVKKNIFGQCRTHDLCLRLFSINFFS